MRKVFAFVLPLLLIASGAWADITFVNGGFEDAGGNLDGWTIQGQNPGSVSVPGTGISSYSGGTGGTVAATVTPGQDPNVPIQQTYNGGYAARVGDSTPWWGYPYQYNSISQSATVTGSTPGNLYFAWAAVLDVSGHSYSSTPYFQVSVFDVDQNRYIYDVKKYEGDGGFWSTSGAWYYSTGNNASYPGWYVESLDLAALGVVVGDELLLTALARDCDPTGHAMYVYLDGFGGTPPPPPNGVPEPTTMLLLGLGLVGLAGFRKRS